MRPQAFSYAEEYYHAPTYLTQDSMPEVTVRMLETNEARPSALLHVTEASDFLAFGFLGHHALRSFDISLARQLSEVSQQAPSAFLFTAKSAIPVADAVRGYYEAKGIEAPLLSSIKPSKSHHEARRLNRLNLSGHVVIVEQFISTGRTFRGVSELALELGAQAISVIRGDWYEDARNSTVKVTDLTSIFKEGMYSIGQRIAKAEDSGRRVA